MKKLKARLNEWADKLDALSVRERGILLAVCLVVLLGVYDYLALTPYLEKRKAHKTLIASVNADMLETESKLNELIAKLEHDPNAALKERIERREVDIKRVMDAVGKSTENLIAPRKMSQVLGYLLSRQSGMAVKSVKNFPAEPISFQANEEQEPEVMMYRHRLSLQLEGTYFQVAGYLKMIEGLKERLYWDEMTFAVKQYPKGELQLDVHTLSLSKELIGVYE